MEQILIVDSEQDARGFIRIHLEQTGLPLIEAESGQQAINLLRGDRIALIILDLMMEGGTSFEVLRYLRDKRSPTLVIALSARKEVEDIITALGSGADDYVTKPFNPMELLARVQALLRRHRLIRPHESTMIRLNELILDADNYLLNNNGARFELTPIESALLRLFMRNPNCILTKREIYREIWKHDNYDDNNLNVYIGKLRVLLGSPGMFHIETVRGIGYCFSGGFKARPIYNT